MKLNLIYVVVYLVLMNLLTLFVYRYDKHCSCKSKWRISEDSLLMVALLGGSPAAFIAQRVFRHKTKKTFFQFRFWLVIFIQAVAGFYLWDKVTFY